MTERMPAALRGAYALALIAAVLAGVSAVFPAGWFLGGALSFEAGPYDSERAVDLAMFRDELRGITGGILALQAVTGCSLLAAAGVGYSGRAAGRGLALGALGLFAAACLVDGGVALWSSLVESGLEGTHAETGATLSDTAVAILPAAAWLVVRLGVAIAATSALLSAATRTFYARAEPG